MSLSHDQNEPNSEYPSRLSNNSSDLGEFVMEEIASDQNVPFSASHSMSLTPTASRRKLNRNAKSYERKLAENEPLDMAEQEELIDDMRQQSESINDVRSL